MSADVIDAAAFWATAGNDLGKSIGDDLVAFVRAHEQGAARSTQRAIGPSQIGMPCTRCLARHVLGCPVERTFNDPWARIIGTAVHAWLQDAAEGDNKALDRWRWETETRVHPDDELLVKGGNADLYDRDRKVVIDHKVVGIAPLKKYRLSGPGDQYRYQGHLYGKGFVKAGREVETVAIAFWPRGGRLSELYVWTEAYDEAIADEALFRFRTIRDQALAVGPALIPLLPADPDCWDCEGRDDL